MNNKAFTLAELLAVVAILAIISLITVPVVVNYINDSKEISTKDSLNMYLKAVDSTILKVRLDNNAVSDGIYTIQSNGNICLNTDCIEIKLKNIPSISGTVEIRDEEIISYNIVINDEHYEKSE